MTNPDKSMAQGWFSGPLQQHRISPATATSALTPPFRPVIKDDPYLAAYNAQSSYTNEISHGGYRLPTKEPLEACPGSSQDSDINIGDGLTRARTNAPSPPTRNSLSNERIPSQPKPSKDTPNTGQTPTVQDSKIESKETASKSKRQQVNSLPSYTAMIAQAILNKDVHQCTLGEVYEYMEKTFPTLGSRGTGWRNCVRHTLSLNDCFLKLHRPENGRSCNWTIHPSYYENFARGDYRKRRNLRKRARAYSWFDPNMIPGSFPQYPREQEIMTGQQSAAAASLLHYPSNIGLWGPQSNYQSSYMPQMNAMPNFMPNMSPTNGHYSSSCTNPSCFCKGNKINLPFSYMS